MKKLIIPVTSIFVVVLWFFLSGRHSLASSNDFHKPLSIDGVNCIVAAFEIQPPWRFNTRLAEPPGEIQRWRKLILLGQSDFLRFLENKEARNMYGRAAVSDEQIDGQRSYVIDRFKHLVQDLEIANLYIVLEPSAKTAHLLVPVAGPQGEYFTALEWINGDWYLVPGTGDISWPVLNAKKIIQAVENQKLEFGQAEDIDRVIRKLSSAYLRR
jgi:hypothetical protein